MKNRLVNLKAIIIFLLVGFPFLSLKICCTTSCITEDFDSLPTTELNISNVQLSYNIHSNGKYHSAFRLEVIGNSLTEIGSAHCKFKINDLPIEDLTLKIEDSNIEYDSYSVNTTLYINFSTTNHIFLTNHPFIITGDYDGTYVTNTSGIYVYSLGIDWGTFVGSQQTSISFIDDYEILSIAPEQPYSISQTNGYFELSWVDMITLGFNTVLNLHPRQLPNEYLQIGITEWNATIGQSRDVPVQNIGIFDLEVIIITPSWINSNVSTFHLTPNQKIQVNFKINSLAALGMNGSIQFISWGFWEPIKIPVVIVHDNSNTSFLLFLQVSSLLSGIILLGIGYYQKDNIKSFCFKFKDINLSKSSNKRNKPSLEENILTTNISEESSVIWESIQTRWEKILPDNELKVIEILYNQGVINQKTIAEELNVSTVTMSRIISRLETKRLVIRERLGMSNMIKLLKDRL